MTDKLTARLGLVKSVLYAGAIALLVDDLSVAIIAVLAVNILGLAIMLVWNALEQRR